MNHKHALTLTAAAIAGSAVIGVPTALAASGPQVSVRVEGLSKTLMAAKSITSKTGSFTRSGQKISDQSALGVLNQATAGKWAGSFSSQYGWYVSKILGQGAPAKTQDYWAFYVNGVYASAGLGETKAKKDARYLLAMVKYPGATPLVSALVAPKTASVGKSFTVKTEDYTTRGKLVALKGAKVSYAGKTVTASGSSLKLKAAKAGKLTVTISKPGFVRNEATVTIKK
jgi:Domain of unknown function (DUF4430)